MEYNMFLYGLADADENYRLVRYQGLIAEPNLVSTIQDITAEMIMDHPEIKHVYLLDWRPGLRWYAMQSLKHPNTMDVCVQFKITCEKEGIRIV